MVRRIVEGERRLRDVAVRGEVTGYSQHPAGYVFFELKDDKGAILRCVVWTEAARTLPQFKNGSAVVARGNVTAYARSSVYQLVVESVALDGVGDVHALFEKLKKKLDAEGLFAEERKRPVPAYPFSVALVSSRSAKGAEDFVTILKNRAPHVRVIWCEASVQGAQAGSQIAGAIAYASRLNVDCIVVTRGGGSFEDLFCFSDERVVRAIAAARHPVISAVGHTVDQQLCDYVADRHFETPSAAANALGQSTTDLRFRIDGARGKMWRSATRAIEARRVALEGVTRRTYLDGTQSVLSAARQRAADARTKLEGGMTSGVERRAVRWRGVRERLQRSDPTERVSANRLEAYKLSARLGPAVSKVLARAIERNAKARATLESRIDVSVRTRRERLAVAVANLDGKNPEAILQRGYAIVTLDGAIVHGPEQAPPGSLVQAKLARGILHARVEEESRE